MSLQTWQSNGWLRPYRTSPAQIAELFAIADRDLEDARTERLSNDWQFGIAYNAALKLCTILLYAEGFRPEKTSPTTGPCRLCPLFSDPDVKTMPIISTPAAANATPPNTILSAASARMKPANSLPSPRGSAKT